MSINLNCARRRPDRGRIIAGTAQTGLNTLTTCTVNNANPTRPKFRQLHGLLGPAYKSVRKAG